MWQWDIFTLDSKERASKNSQRQIFMDRAGNTLDWLDSMGGSKSREIAGVSEGEELLLKLFVNFEASRTPFEIETIDAQACPKGE